VQSVDGQDGESVEWRDEVVGQEPPATTTRAAGGRHLAAQRRDGHVAHDHGDDDDDDDAVFGELVVSELRHIRDPETRLILRHNILTTICETRLACLRGGTGAGRASLRRLNVGGQLRPAAPQPTVNGCWTYMTSTSTRTDTDHLPDHHDYAMADNGQIVIKEEQM